MRDLMHDLRDREGYAERIGEINTATVTARELQRQFLHGTVAPDLAEARATGLRDVEALQELARQLAVSLGELEEWRAAIRGSDVGPTLDELMQRDAGAGE